MNVSFGQMYLSGVRIRSEQMCSSKVKIIRSGQNCLSKGRIKSGQMCLFKVKRVRSGQMCPSKDKYGGVWVGQLCPSGLRMDESWSGSCAFPAESSWILYLFNGAGNPTPDRSSSFTLGNYSCSDCKSLLNKEVDGLVVEWPSLCWLGFGKCNETLISCFVAVALWDVLLSSSSCYTYWNELWALQISVQHHSFIWTNIFLFQKFL